VADAAGMKPNTTSPWMQTLESLAWHSKMPPCLRASGIAMLADIIERYLSYMRALVAEARAKFHIASAYEALGMDAAELISGHQLAHVTARK